MFRVYSFCDTKIQLKNKAEPPISLTETTKTWWYSGKIDITNR